MSTVTNALICGVCQRVRGAHDELNHEFSPNGVLIPKKPAETVAEVRSVSSIDSVLRILLISKGIITGEELQVLEEAVRDQLSQTRRDANSSPQPGASG